MTENNAITINTAIEILERAVCSKKSYIEAQICPRQKNSLWTQILRLAGKKFRRTFYDA